ncbi:MAG: DUF3576 domain-containing protein [Rickettsiales bacterium]|nr:DUF3576 domain-containing protein [Rickettsiales bacterium]
MKHFSFVLLSALLILCGCADDGEKLSAGRPIASDRARWENRGRVTGDEDTGGGFTLFGGEKKGEAAAGSPIGVNSFLWRATLDTLSFMPIASADPFGGVVITDWYEDPQTPGERFKVNALILDRTLRADGVRISVFKQKKDASAQWADTQVEPSVGREVEDTILTRARQLRVTQAAQ